MMPNIEMSFEDWVKLIVFSDNPAKWKVETLKRGILAQKGIEYENTGTN